MTLISIFFVFIYFDSKTKEKITFLKKIKYINAHELSGTAKDGGGEYIERNHPYTFDLDFFGENSIYSKINRTHHLFGRKKLAYILQNPLNRKEHILKRQAIIKELADKISFRDKFRVYAQKVNDKCLLLKVNKINRFLKSGIQIYPLVSVVFITLSIYYKAYVWIIGLILLSYLLILILRKKFIVDKNNKETFIYLNKCYEMFRAIGKAHFYHCTLRHKQQIVENEIIGEFNKVKSIMLYYDFSENKLVRFILNEMFLWDFQLCILTGQWIEKNHSRIHKWQKLLENFDTWISLSTYAFNHPFMIYPTVEPKNYCYINAKAVKHPLISGQNIPNDYHIEGKGAVDLITGANMSGKSTFLRTVGVNLVFAMIGLPVYANTFTFSPVKVYTSMRTTDSINKGESYFYKELKRLKEMLTLAYQKKSLILLDEILKGTNSIDSLKGSRKILEQLLQSESTTLIATHNLALCALAEDYESIRCKYFDTAIKKKEIKFSYKIRDGIASQTNAIELMRQLKIIDSPSNK